MAARHYIIMADIISSRTIDKKEDFMGQFKALTSLANKRFKDSIVSPLTITLGDEFQGIVSHVDYQIVEFCTRVFNPHKYKAIKHNQYTYILDLQK